MENFDRSQYPVLEGLTVRIDTPCGSMYVTVNKYEGEIVEVFARLGKAGGCAACQNDTIARVISVALQSGADIRRIIKQLIGAKCPESNGESSDRGVSCPDAIGKVLQSELDKLKVKEVGNGNKE